jgi:arylsulfatase
VPWDRFGTREFDGPEERWELYNINEDFSQGVDLAEKFPEKLAELQSMFDEEAVRNNVYPMREPGSLLSVGVFPPTNLGGLTKMTYTKAHVRMPERSVINLKNCSYRITADVVVTDESHGVIACQGGNMAGWSLYLDDDRLPVYHYNWVGHEHYVIRGHQPLEAGPQRIVVEFAYEGGLGGSGTAVLLVNEAVVGHGRIEKTVPFVYSMSGETFDVGVDTGSPVGNYHHNYNFVGAIMGVTLERLSEPTPEIAAQIREGEFRASLATQ